MIIVAATILPSNRWERPQAVVTAEFEDGSMEDVLSYYDDELTFVPSEIIGLTKKGVQDLWFAKDQVYIRT